jgi:hypothetical protein
MDGIAGEAGEDSAMFNHPMCGASLGRARFFYAPRRIEDEEETRS